MGFWNWKRNSRKVDAPFVPQPPPVAEEAPKKPATPPAPQITASVTAAVRPGPWLTLQMSTYTGVRRDRGGWNLTVNAKGLAPRDESDTVKTAEETLDWWLSGPSYRATALGRREVGKTFVLDRLDKVSHLLSGTPRYPVEDAEEAKDKKIFRGISIYCDLWRNEANPYVWVDVSADDLPISDEDVLEWMKLEGCDQWESNVSREAWEVKICSRHEKDLRSCYNCSLNHLKTEIPAVEKMIYKVATSTAKFVFLVVHKMTRQDVEWIDRISSQLDPLQEAIIIHNLLEITEADRLTAYQNQLHLQIPTPHDLILESVRNSKGEKCNIQWIRTREVRPVSHFFLGRQDGCTGDTINDPTFCKIISILTAHPQISREFRLLPAIASQLKVDASCVMISDGKMYLETDSAKHLDERCERKSKAKLMPAKKCPAEIQASEMSLTMLSLSKAGENEPTQEAGKENAIQREPTEMGDIVQLLQSESIHIETVQEHSESVQIDRTITPHPSDTPVESEEVLECKQ